MSSTKKGNRITLILKSPNPLFEKWLTEWKENAEKNDSKMKYCFKTALESLKKYPVPLESGRECKILKGFGDKLCVMLDKKLKDYKNGKIKPAAFDTLGQPTSKENRPAAKKRRLSNESNVASTPTKEYIPQHGSGVYAILITLYEKSLEANYPGFLTKLEIIRNGQHLVNTSFTKPDPHTRYTAWSSMKTLLAKNLVSKKSNPAKFSLTDDGMVLAKKIYKTTNVLTERVVSEDTGLFAEGSSSSSNGNSSQKPLFTRHVSSSSIQSCSSSNAAIDECVILPPDSFDIILYVDKQETCGSKTDVLDDPLLAELKTMSILHEVQHLKVGDYAWICRNKTTKQELILPYIVERKRMDDFASSIKDGRYHEQKFRLKRCGVKNVTYLIESYGNNDCNVGLPLATLYQAATNTAVQDGFSVRFVANLRATARYLSCFTNLLTDKFQSKTLVGCPKEDLPQISVEDDVVSLMGFKGFNQGSSKNKDLYVRDLFVRVLIQVKGMSVEKALAVVEKYPTPNCLYKAYKSTSTVVGEKLLSTIRFGKLNKSIGLSLSKTIYQFFTMKSF